MNGYQIVAALVVVYAIGVMHGRDMSYREAVQAAATCPTTTDKK